MKTIKLEICFKSYTYSELPEKDRQLIDSAKEAALKSYSPYSKFGVGAAALLDNGVVVCGSNQENAAYPSGICAERTTLFYANATYPDIAVDTLAIAAHNHGAFIDSPIPPCGGCRQVMIEVEQRYSKQLRLLLYSTNEIYELYGVKSLLPLYFGQHFL